MGRRRRTNAAPRRRATRVHLLTHPFHPPTPSRAAPAGPAMDQNRAAGGRCDQGVTGVAHAVPRPPSSTAWGTHGTRLSEPSLPMPSLPYTRRPPHFRRQPGGHGTASFAAAEAHGPHGATAPHGASAPASTSRRRCRPAAAAAGGRRRIGALARASACANAWRMGRRCSLLAQSTISPVLSR